MVCLVVGLFFCLFVDCDCLVLLIVWFLIFV